MDAWVLDCGDETEASATPGTGQHVEAWLPREPQAI
jgi:hypothetical protein